MRTAATMMTAMALWTAAAPAMAHEHVRSVERFRDALAAHGTWLEVPDYGHCWRPDPAEAGAAFVPFTQGEWVLTDRGWTWRDHFNWGVITMHYGGWVRDAARGWLWVPDDKWSPARVAWREGGGYVGWLPLPPRGVRAAEIPDYDPAARFAGWTFVVEPRFVGEVPLAHRLSQAAIPELWPRTHALEDTRRVHGQRIAIGPSPERIAAALHYPLQPIRIEAVSYAFVPGLPPNGVPRGLQPRTASLRGPARQ